MMRVNVNQNKPKLNIIEAGTRLVPSSDLDDYSNACLIRNMIIKDIFDRTKNLGICEKVYNMISWRTYLCIIKGNPRIAKNDIEMALTLIKVDPADIDYIISYVDDLARQYKI